MTTLSSTVTYPSVTAPRGRLATSALWTVHIGVAALLLLAGGSKLAGAPPMVAMFQTIGLGQWLRYLTGAIEVTAAVALLVPALAPFGALLIVPTMIGAVATHLFIIGGSPVAALSLLLGALVILTARRRQLVDAWPRRR
jgi:putative oxidoreductase